MKIRTKRILLVTVILFCGLLGFFGFNVYYGIHYVHQHCIKLTGLAFQMYASDHKGELPCSTNGFGNALLSLVETGSADIRHICGPDDDGHIFKVALTEHSVVPENQCSRVYVQGLSETNDPGICILFDRNSCKGGDHGRSPWGHPVRELCLLDGSMQIIRDEDWLEFSQRQVELLIAAGFTRTNALHYYPAANSQVSKCVSNSNPPQRIKLRP